MTRATLTKTTPPGSNAAAGVALTETAASTSGSGNQFSASGKDLVLAHNTGASPATITINSTADPYGRTGDIEAETINAGVIKVFGPFSQTGWQQTDGNVYLEASASDVKIAVIPL